MAKMEALWQVLPDEHQVSLALKFVDSVMASAYRPYFLHLAAQKWSLQTTELESAFPTIELRSHRPQSAGSQGEEPEDFELP